MCLAAKNIFFFWSSARNRSTNFAEIRRICKEYPKQYLIGHR
jgi:hypothetical protein